MPNKYSIETKKTVVELIKLQGKSTSLTAKEYNVPVKTVENWITMYNKDKHCFDIEKNNEKEKVTN